MTILELIRQRQKAGKKSIAVLVDPDKVDDPSRLRHLIDLANESCIDFFLVGGSLITTPNLPEVIQSIKENANIPVVLFPGSSLQIDPSADAILFLSLISGRNAELLIGQHVQAAPLLKSHRMEVLPTGYLLISTGKTSSVAYISNTTPIPDDKYSLAASTALAAAPVAATTACSASVGANTGAGALTLPSCPRHCRVRSRRRRGRAPAAAWARGPARALARA